MFYNIFSANYFGNLHKSYYLCIRKIVFINRKQNQLETI